MIEIINEKIKVGAVFSGSQIIPKWFLWKDRKYKISNVQYCWSAQKGISKLKFYSVSDSKNLYEICFDTGNMEWKLTKIYIEG